MLGSAAPEPVEQVIVLDSDAPSLSVADRARIESRVESVLSAGNVAIAGQKARSSARACETQVCLQRTAAAYGITHWVRAEISGDDREYRVKLAAGRVGSPTPLTQSAGDCLICGMDDLAAALETRTLVIRTELSGAPAAAKPGGVRSVGWRKMDDGQPRARAKVNPLRPTGIALLALGSASVVGGAVLMGIDGEDVRRRCDNANLDAGGDCRFVQETRAGGIAMLTGGVLAVAGGITLVSIEKNQRRRADLRLRAGYNRVVFAGRF